MKIEINAPINPAEDYTIYTEEGKRLTQPRGGIFAHYWDDGDVEMLIGEKDFNKFQAGKYEFNIPAWKVRLIEGKTAAKNNEQLKFISQFY